ncbi:NHLP leader peptide family RiPP precursor [Paenibacillus sp. FSL M7-0420]|uniref:NHLP leader peptide family RiPP precursor n=1 Tax=unclassified Paenibacillus TaxID=185978 RepID=UPI0040407893
MIVLSVGVLKNQVIQKAWEDPAFKQRLLADPKAALQEVLGINLPDNITLKTVEEGSNEFYLVIPPSPSSDVMKTRITPMGTW